MEQHIRPWSGGPPRIVAWIGACVILLAGLFLFDTFWGDPSIYLPYARNIAHGDFFSYNPGEFSSGSTSPLWALLLALPYLLETGVAGAKIFSILCTLGAFGLTLMAVRRINGETTGGNLAALYLVEMMTLYGVLMYESSLIVALVSASLILCDKVARAAAESGTIRFGRDTILLAIVWGMLPLSRPDAVVLVPLQILAIWGFSSDRSAGTLVRLILLALAAAIPSAAYFGYSLVKVGAVSVSSQCRGFALKEGAQQIGPIYYSKAALGYVGAILFAILPACIGFDMLRRAGRSWLAAVGMGMLILYPIMLIFISPVTNDLPRYFLPVAPLMVIAVGRTLSRWEVEWTGNGSKWWFAIGAVLAMFLVRPVLSTIGEATEQRTRGYTFHEIMEQEAAEIVNGVAKPGDTLLSYEVQDRYFLRPDVGLLSLDGITDGKVAPYLESADMTAFIRRYRPDFWIANAAVNYRPYLRKSILYDVADAFEADTTLRETTVGGITFELIRRRERPMPRGFAGWTMLFALRYDS